MAKLSVREAARRFDVSRPTLVKRLKSGQLSGEPIAGGGWLIDPAELIRAGYVARGDGGQIDQSKNQELTAIAGGLPVNGDAEIAALRAELEQERIRRAAAEVLAEERARHIEDLRRMLPAPDAGPGRKRGWWPW